MTDKYFVHCPELGYETFKTEKAAQVEAKNRLDIERDNASDGWCENVEHIVWGEIRQVTKVDSEILSEDSSFDYTCGYEFTDI